MVTIKSEFIRKPVEERKLVLEKNNKITCCGIDLCLHMK